MKEKWEVTINYFDGGMITHEIETRPNSTRILELFHAPLENQTNIEEQDDVGENEEKIMMLMEDGYESQVFSYPPVNFSEDEFTVPFSLSEDEIVDGEVFCKKISNE